MLDAPPLIYIDYKSLSNNEIIAEIQKDVIVQIVKAIGNETTIIIENQGSKNTPTKNIILSAKCLQCLVTENTQHKIVATSIKKNTNRNQFTKELIFDVINQTEKKTAWKVELTEKNLIYYISAKQQILPNSVLEQKTLEVLPCTTGEDKCSPKYSFPNSTEALKQLALYSNKKTNFPLKAGQEIDPKALSQEILIRAGEKTRVMYTPSSSLTVQTYGKALSNGGRGEIIRVQINDWFEKSTASHPTGIIEGTVIAPGEVEYATK